jgi:hypothetical protein
MHSDTLCLNKQKKTNFFFNLIIVLQYSQGQVIYIDLKKRYVLVHSPDKKSMMNDSRSNNAYRWKLH